MKLFVLILFFLAVLVLSVTTFRNPGLQTELAKLDGEARAILDHESNAGKFAGLTVQRNQLDLVVTGTAEREVRSEAIRLLKYGSREKRIRGLRAGVVVDKVVLGTPEFPTLQVKLESSFVDLRGRIPQGGGKEQFVSVVRELGWQPVASGLKDSRDVAGGEWFDALPDFLRAFLAGADAATFDLNQERLSLARTVADERALAEMLGLARAWAPPGLIIEAGGLRVAPGLRLRREEGVWIAEGVVADEGLLAVVRQAVDGGDAAAAGRNRFELLQVVPGSPVVPWVRRLPSFFPQFAAGVGEGAEITVSGNQVVLGGDVTDTGTATRLQELAATAFGPGMVVVSRLIYASNPLRKLGFDFGRSAGDPVVVTGGIPNPQIGKQLETALQAAFPSRRTDVKGLVVNPAAQHEPFVDGVSGFLELLGKRTNGTGSLRLDGREASLTGVVADEITRDALGRALETRLGPTFVVANGLVVTPGVKVPQPYPVERIFFGDNQATLAKAEAAKLTALSERIKGVPVEARILVKGFASRTGTAAANLAISRRRAEAVRGELVRLGVAEHRIDLLAMGQANGSAAGRNAAEDRRVEVIVLE